MRLHLTTDPRQKHGIDVLTFNHNLYKSKKHINGYFIDAPFIPGFLRLISLNFLSLNPKLLPR
mgnify:CR=1 FL=1